MKIINLPKLSREIEFVPYANNSNRITVPYYPQGVKAGFPSPADDFKAERISLDARYLDHPESTYLIRVKGNSMYPTLHKGDILVVKAHITAKHNDIAIFSVNDSAFTVKRLNKQRNILSADNKEFETISIQPSDTVVCLGVVKHIIRSF